MNPETFFSLAFGLGGFVLFGQVVRGHDPFPTESRGKRYCFCVHTQRLPCSDHSQLPDDSAVGFHHQRSWANPGNRSLSFGPSPSHRQESTRACRLRPQSGRPLPAAGVFG